MQPTEEEFAEFFRSSWAKLYRLVVAVSGDPRSAEDDLQAALAKVYSSWGKVRRADHPEAYVRRIVLNQVLGSRRYGFARHERPHASVETGRVVGSPEAGVVDRDAMWSAIRALPPRQRAVVVLRYYEDLDEAQIAEALGCSRGTVKSQASSALATLRRTVGAPDYAPDYVEER